MSDAPLAGWLDAGPNGRRWRALIVDDSPSIRALICAALDGAGFDVVEAGSAESAKHRIATDDPDIVLLDIQLPGQSGLELLRDLRRSSGLPVLLVSTLSEEDDRIAGLDIGADDYVIKPFSPAELVARTRATLRGRRGGMIASTIDRGRVAIDLHHRRAEVDGVDVPLSAREFDLLALLAADPGRAFSRTELLAEVWDSRGEWQDPDTVTEHVRRVRKKLAAVAGELDVIETVRGGGYRFRRA